MSETHARVATYARISEDPSGEAAGVTRQQGECRRLAEQRGWEVIAELADNDISALDGKRRPGYTEVLRLVEAGAIDYVVVWQSSRLIRSRRERAEAIELLGRKRVGIIAVKGQDLDLSNAYGRGMAGLLGEFDTMESEVKSERVAAAAAQRAKDGRPNGGLGYGWTKTGTGSAASYAVCEEEAAVVREITDRLLSGDSLLGITNDLNTRGIPAPGTASRWGKTSVSKLAQRASNAGLRVHHKGKTDEAVSDGCWPALLPRDRWERVTSLLNQPTRRSNGHVRPGARRHLLTWGIGACGVCGGRLRVGVKGNSLHGTKKPLYLCDDRGCVGRDQARVDELVKAVTIARLSRPDALDWLAGDDEAAQVAAARVAELQGRLDALADRYADGKVGLDALERVEAQLRPQIQAAERERRAANASLDLSQLEELAGPSASARWEELSVPQRRAVLQALGMRVLVDRVARRGPGFDPESVRIEWNR